MKCNKLVVVLFLFNFSITVLFAAGSAQDQKSQKPDPCIWSGPEKSAFYRYGQKTEKHSVGSVPHGRSKSVPPLQLSVSPVVDSFLLTPTTGSPLVRSPMTSPSMMQFRYETLPSAYLGKFGVTRTELQTLMQMRQSKCDLFVIKVNNYYYVFNRLKLKQKCLKDGELIFPQDDLQTIIKVLSQVKSADILLADGTLLPHEKVGKTGEQFFAAIAAPFIDEV